MFLQHQNDASPTLLRNTKSPPIMHHSAVVKISGKATPGPQNHSQRTECFLKQPAPIVIKIRQ